MQKFKGLLTQSCLTLCDPKNYSPPGSSVHGISPARILEWEPFPSPGYLPNAGIKPRSPALQVGSLPAEPPGKPKNSAVGGLSLLQRIFPSQEWNPGLLHCRRILYQLSCDHNAHYFLLKSITSSQFIAIMCMDFLKNVSDLYLWV